MPGFGLDPVGDLLRLGAVHLLVKVVIDHDDGGGATAGQAFDELNRHFAVGRDGAAVRVEFLLELLADLVATSELEILFNIFRLFSRLNHIDVNRFHKIDDCLNWMQFSENEKAIIENALDGISRHEIQLIQ